MNKQTISKILNNPKSTKKEKSIFIKLTENKKNRLELVCNYYDISKTQFIEMMIDNSYEAMKLEKE